MSSSKKNDVISVAPPHSIKKFELISEYVKAWINILMLNKKCRGIVYIDCMSNSGVYKDDEGNEIEGTPLLVSEIIAEAMTRYTDKQAYIFFNDFWLLCHLCRPDCIGYHMIDDDFTPVFKKWHHSIPLNMCIIRIVNEQEMHITKHRRELASNLAK